MPPVKSLTEVNLFSSKGLHVPYVYEQFELVDETGEKERIWLKLNPSAKQRLVLLLICQELDDILAVMDEKEKKQFIRELKETLTQRQKN